MILTDKFERILEGLNEDQPIRLVYIGNPSLGLMYNHKNWKDLCIVSIKDDGFKYEVRGERPTKKIEMIEHTNGPLQYSYKMLYDTFVKNNKCTVLSFFMFGHYLDIMDVYENTIQFYYSKGEDPFRYFF